MRILSLLIALLVAGTGAPGLARAQIWAMYESEAGRFRVDMPGKPTESQQTSPKGNTQTAAMLLTKSAVYVVMFGDAPPNTHSALPEAEVLEKIRDGMAQGHKLLRDKPITIAGHPGREFVIARTDNTIHVTRETIVGRRLYQMFYGVEGQTEPTSPDVRRFLDSFVPK
jgi:hypothetical protein